MVNLNHHIIKSKVLSIFIDCGDLHECHAEDFPSFIPSEVALLNEYHNKPLIREIGMIVIFQIDEILNVGSPFETRRDPHSKRLLKLCITDGVSSIVGIEISPIAGLQANTAPGVKIAINHRAIIRRGALLLDSSCCKVLGGEVERLTSLMNNVLTASGAAPGTNASKPINTSDNISREPSTVPSVSVVDLVTPNENHLSVLENTPSLDRSYESNSPTLLPDIQLLSTVRELVNMSKEDSGARTKSSLALFPSTGRVRGVAVGLTKFKLIDAKKQMISTDPPPTASKSYHVSLLFDDGMDILNVDVDSDLAATYLQLTADSFHKKFASLSKKEAKQFKESVMMKFVHFHGIFNVDISIRLKGMEESKDAMHGSQEFSEYSISLISYADSDIEGLCSHMLLTM